MKFLADAHVSTKLVTMLRGAGHDCTDTRAVPPATPDVDVLQLAVNDDRVVITADKDFGELVFSAGIPCPGVVLLRIEAADEAARVSRVQAVLPVLERRLPGSFITITNTGIRIRPLE